MSDQEFLDKLLGRVARGELSPAAAEALAREHGLGPLSEQPDPAEFDPMQQPRWTVPMAVAWIKQRTPDAVRDNWDRYCDRCLDWQPLRWTRDADGLTYSGYVLERRRLPYLTALWYRPVATAGQPIDANKPMSFQTAFDVLARVCQRGDLEMTGIEISTGKLVTLPATDWREFRHTIDEGGIRIGPVNETGTTVGLYADVTVSSARMLELWPVPLPRLKPPLPEVMRPDGPGYMPLFCAALWIATKGGAVTFDPETTEPWQAAYRQLLDALSSEQVHAIGIATGLPESIPGHVFAGLRVDYPYQDTHPDLVATERSFLESCPYGDDETWQKGFSDSIKNRFETRWSQIMLAKEDVAGLWPFSLTAPMRTGAPGRPTSMHLVEVEFEARCERGEVAETLKEEALILSAWLSATHPQMPKTTPKTITNNLRPRFSAWQRARN